MHSFTLACSFTVFALFVFLSGSFLRLMAFFSYVISSLLYVAEAIYSDEYLRLNTTLTAVCASRTQPESNTTSHM